jgi:hypothetical protein
VWEAAPSMTMWRSTRRGSRRSRTITRIPLLSSPPPPPPPLLLLAQLFGTPVSPAAKPHSMMKPSDAPESSPPPLPPPPSPPLLASRMARPPLRATSSRMNITAGGGGRVFLLCSTGAVEDAAAEAPLATWAGTEAGARAGRGAGAKVMGVTHALSSLSS